jgi:23S rRNA (uracil1939-C5)-methyltransferase
MDPGRSPGRAALIVRILRVAAGGDGVGKLEDGRTVFVPRAAPGDLVELDRVRLSKRFARARIARLLEPGPNRVVPPCPHYTRDDCGGCQLQHLNAAAQLSAKQSIVGETLRRVGKVDVPDPLVIPAGRVWEYRSKITLARDGRGRIGLHPLDRPDQTFELEHCYITEPALMALWTVVHRHRTLLPEDLAHLVFRLDREGGRHVIVQTSGQRAWPGGNRLYQALSAADISAVIWYHPESGAARVVAGSSEAFPATVFEQVNPEMGDTARAYAIERLGTVQGLHVWDLYSGIGETTARLLSAGASVESVEADSRAVALARTRARLALGLAPESRLPSGSECHSGRVEETLDRLDDPDLIIANPPRGGIDGAAIDRILTRSPRRLVYISCDPATLARDIARLASRFRAESVQAFDLFPQTAHVESVAVLEAK